MILTSKKSIGDLEFKFCLYYTFNKRLNCKDNRNVLYYK